MHRDDVQITHPKLHEIALLEQLWIDVFADPPELIEAFFDAFPPQQHGWVLRRGDEILSSAYLLHGNLFLSEKEVQASAYVYAVATPSHHRGKGYAGALMRFFTELADRRSLLLYTRPASPELFQWYAQVMQTRPSIGMESRIVAVRPIPTKLELRCLTPSEYGQRRERLLAGRPHIALSDAFLKLQEQFLEGDGAGYYALGTSCCACEKHGDELVFKELLAAEAEFEPVIQTMLQHLSAETAVVPSPSDTAQPNVAFRSDAVPASTSWGLLLD